MQDTTSILKTMKRSYKGEFYIAQKNEYTCASDDTRHTKAKGAEESAGRNTVKYMYLV